MKKGIYTELACERERPKNRAGYQYEKQTLGICHCHTLTVHTQSAARAMHCAKGIYRTLHFPSVLALGEEERKQVSSTLASLLLQMTAVDKIQDRPILVVGLGNRAQTVDALGPLAADRVYATAHLRHENQSLFNSLACAAIAVFSPGVTANSGLCSAQAVAAIAQHASPALVILIDALVARSFSRIGRTLQISNSGLLPGNGIGLSRSAIDGQLLGCPVISIGAPTATEAATLVHDVLASVGKPPPRALREKMPRRYGYLICPTEADRIVTELAAMIASAINSAFGVPHL